MGMLADEQSLEVVFVKLPNSFEFRGVEKLIPIAEEVFAAGTAPRVSYYDIDDCVGRKTDLNNPHVDEMLYFQPTAEGHRLFADCLAEWIATKQLWYADL